MASDFRTWWQKSGLRSWGMKIKSGFHWLWQKIQQHPYIATGIIVIFIALTTFVFLVHLFGWDWTGFNGGYPKTTTKDTVFNGKIVNGQKTTDYEQAPAKTFWDWLQLLLVPLLLAIAGVLFNQIQKDREQRAIDERAEREKRETEQRAEREKRETEQRAKIERETAETRDKTEREIAADNQREAALQAYLDKMSELLLEKKLRESAKGDEIRKIARVRTLTVLRGLDTTRKASVLHFLHESDLLDKNKLIINLNGADLSDADLSGADLSGVDLSGVDLSGVELEGADLSGADLSGADLSGAILGVSYDQISFGRVANLSDADLSRALLSGADLSGTDLSGAILSRADLSDADLSNANLKDATGITTEELEKQAKSLQDATMPDGSIHP